ncbi:transcriptional regulator [Malaciobacter molluscorum LMG 25693]|uniref:Transcriptional regulator n=1 Tax=Malaciobacter molluscorum LMG 25693 TaxID=870501 RepID=A0A2G1DKZ8_9BACT|nr:helix-turn-helix transcriptional regulator [Malaciobacter molluscorum]AXX92753.1 transcriptional regulator, XRE family [Malaciobacter molluscorum LMG 25693]PHO19167.1 transcriptional regulator [Malaciobacter molluscorum LMG 25693]RXJ97483.1 transcriptional regulator [Malaciobacter molluscorum]
MFLTEVTQEDLNNFHNIISKNVRRIRKEKKFTQLDVSLALGLSTPSFITNAESLNSSKRFNLNQLYKLSIFFEVDICEFFKV